LNHSAVHKDFFIEMKNQQTEGVGQILLPDRNQIWDGDTQNWNPNILMKVLF
jgi:hypothetical protein